MGRGSAEGRRDALQPHAAARGPRRLRVLVHARTSKSSPVQRHTPHMCMWRSSPQVKGRSSSDSSGRACHAASAHATGLTMRARRAHCRVAATPPPGSSRPSARASTSTSAGRGCSTESRTSPRCTRSGRATTRRREMAPPTLTPTLTLTLTKQWARDDPQAREVAPSRPTPTLTLTLALTLAQRPAGTRGGALATKPNPNPDPN